MFPKFLRWLCLVTSLITLVLPATPLPVASATAPTLANPLLFVSHVPTPADAQTVVTTFGNHEASPYAAGRGGDLWIRYADGTLRNLTAAAGYGVATGFQGANAIAVRDPAVYWDGTKALFSMVVGAPLTPSATVPNYYWQLYEVSGFLNPTGPITITKVPNQPLTYNNLMPTYGTDDRIIFVSDQPRAGSAIYPLRDEYNMFTTNTGLWSLDPNTGDLFQIDTQPSGDFNPSIDSFGRLIFVRWDHLERDQQSDIDVILGGPCRYCTFNYANESITATSTMTNAEVFPEPRPQRTDLLAGTNLYGHHMNEFLPWTINEDGTGGETLNHIGRHELLEHVPPSFTNDPNLVHLYYTNTVRYNPNPITKFLQIREDPAHPGTYFGVDVLERTHGAGQVISMTAPPTTDADHIAVKYITHRATYYTNFTNTVNSTGHYRDPLPLVDGTLIAVHTVITGIDFNIGTASQPRSRFDFRLKTLALGGNGYWAADQTLTSGISKTLSYYITNTLVSYSGYLWELNPVEVVARARPARVNPPGIGAPESQMFAQAGVTPAELQAWLRQNNLALAVSRNVTTRDGADKQQPFRLQVGTTGTQTITGTGTLYHVSYIQFFQGDLLRGFTGGATMTVPVAGRRVLAQPLHDPSAMGANIPNPTGPAGSMVLGADGSMAAFVPARRPLTWQLTDAGGAAVVRERYWLTYQPGEMRVCTSCHGLNQVDQTGNAAPQNPPQALYELLMYWKSQQARLPLYLPYVRK